MTKKKWEYIRGLQKAAVEAIRTKTGDLRYFDRMIKLALLEVK